MGRKDLHSLLDYFICMIWFSIHYYFFLLIIVRQRSAGFLWIILYMIVIQPTVRHRGLGKIKYTIGPIFFTFLNKLLIKHENTWFLTLQCLTENIGQGSNDIDICLLIILLIIFICLLYFYLFVGSCKLRYSKLLNSHDSFSVQKTFLIFKLTVKSPFLNTAVIKTMVNSNEEVWY